MAGFGTLDLIAIAFFAAAWIGYLLAVEIGPHSRRSLNTLMNQRRERWIMESVKRENRIIDTQVMNGLQNGTAFFAAPDGGQIQVSGLSASNYTTNASATERNGFISLVPGGRTGSRVILENMTLSGINSSLPSVHQNYQGTVTIRNTRINSYSGARPVVEAKPAEIYDIYRDGVKIQ